jgi:hypothetical protein
VARPCSISDSHENPACQVSGGRVPKAHQVPVTRDIPRRLRLPPPSEKRESRIFMLCGAAPGAGWETLLKIDCPPDSGGDEALIKGLQGWSISWVVLPLPNPFLK